MKMCKCSPFLLFLCAGLMMSANCPAAQTTPVISEFLAINNSGLPDEDGEFSDWLEIYNPTPAAVDLEGWFLTDNPAQLIKWRLPATNLAAFSYLVVFASGKDRTNAGAPLHTNFRLAGGGEFLALVEPDGTTIASLYSPRFPEQRGNTSYGLGMLLSPAEYLVQTGAQARVLVPTANIGAAWTGTGYDDSAWLSGPTGIGFDTGTNYDSVIGTDIEAQMRTANASAYIRVPFNVPDPSLYQELTLRLRYDDGVIAYLNGTELTRRNAPANATWNSAATDTHGSDAGASGFLRADFDTTTDPYTPSQQGGAPGPAVQAANTGSTGSFLRLIYDNVNGQNNSIAFAQTAAGLFPIIEADFDFRITSAADPADGFAFMLIPTSMYGTSGVGVNPVGAVEEPNFPNVFAIGFDMYPHASQNDVSVHWNNRELQNVTIPRSTLEMVAGQFHHCNLVLTYRADGAHVTVTITPNVNTGGGSPFVAINDLLIPDMPQFDTRVQMAGRTGGLNMSVDLDNLNVQFGSPKGLVPFEDFDVSAALPSLQAGANVLAVHGLNVAAANGDFLVQPQLIARSVILQTASPLYFDDPTPGAINNRGEADLAPPAEFSVAGGVFTNNLTVALSSPVPGAVIRYTLDGSAPTEESPQYAAPLVLTGSTMVSARVYAAGYLPSDLASESYTVLDAGAAAFSSNLPLIIIDTFGQIIQQDMEPRATASVTVIDRPKLTNRVTLLDPPDYHGRAGVEGRGQTSWGFAKKPMNIELRNDNDQDIEVSLLGMPAESDWILLNPYSDKTFMNNFLAYELYEKMGHYAVRRRFVEVFLNGRWQGGAADASGKVDTDDYVGIYVLLEKIKIDDSRVDIARLSPEDNTEPEITGGYIWKKDKNSPGDIDFTTSSGQLLKYHDPAEELTPVQRQWLLNYLNEFEGALYGPNWRDPAIGYAQYINVNSFVDFHWIVEFTKQIDGYRLSNFMHKDRGRKIRMSPIWDWNLSFGNANYLEGGLTNGWYYPLIAAQAHIWLRRLLADPDFNQRLIDRWGELRQDLFHPSNVLARVDEIAAYLDEAQARDFTKWPRLSTYIWPNPDGANNNNPPRSWDVNYSTPGTYSNLIHGAKGMKQWIAGRFAWIDSLYLQAPEFNRAGGDPTLPLAISAPLGTIYYTVDGSDPRLTGGQVSPNAREYAGEFIPGENARIFARAWLTNNWSPPAKVNFGDPVPWLAISEIMYHPEPGPGFNDEDFEYVELLNPGTSAIDLTGVRLAGGIHFTFPTGPLEATGSATTNDFDGHGTAYALAKLGNGPGATVTPGGPAANFLQLTTPATGINRNRIAFDQTAAGPYDVVTVDFDFRGRNTSPAPAVGEPTVQTFDGGGTAYAVTPTTGPNIPAVLPPDAGSDGSFLRITPQVNNLVQAVHFDRTATSIYRNVRVTFDFRITGGADGMGFAFLNTATHGISGISPAIGGFSETPNIANAIGVGFDIYNNGPTPAEPNANHVSLHWNGAQVSSVAAIPALTLAAGVFHRAEITIQFRTTPTTRALVTVKIAPNVYGSGGAPETLFDEFVINNVPAYIGRVAFGARTGGLNANQDIDNLSVQYFNDLETAGGLSLALLPAGTYGTTGAGTGTNDYLDLPNLANTFALNFNLHNAPFINDATAHWNGAAAGSAFIPPADLDLDDGAFHHAHLEIARGAEGSSVTLTLTPDVFGAPGAPLTVFSDLFVPGYFPEDARAEFAGRSGGLDLGVDLENVLMSYGRFAPNWLAPGERVLVVSSNAAFQARYGTELPVAGEFVGRLANADDRLQLFGPYGEPILDFTYRDNWYPITDGNGFALEFSDPQLPSGAWSDATNWRASSQEQGSPGEPPPPPPSFVPVLITEVLSHSELPETDAIELHNPTAAEADVAYWFLTDDFNTPRKYRLPANTTIAPGGYLVVRESAFNAAPGSPGSFALRAEGDEVYVFSGNAAGELTGYYHGFDFGPAEPNVSFGRLVTSAGAEQFVAQAALTLGAENAGPKIGPVVISEIMYHPPDYPGAIDNQEDEFIELFNLSSEPAPLYDVDHPENTWRLRDAVGFHFPPNTVLPANERLVVVSFDPVLAPDLLETFRTTYGLDPSVPVLGPYDGKLDNSSDSVELTKPSAPDPDTLLPDSILVERVKYRDQAPWSAAADGLGLSLQRIDPSAYGNDPANWLAGAPNPGLPFAGGAPPVITTQPQSQTVVELTPATFTVAASGPGPLTYLWMHNGSLIPGATTASLTIASVAKSDAGEYTAIVIGPAVATVSSNATLTVLGVPTILTQPQTQRVLPGENATFAVVASGSGPLSYQWFRNGEEVQGATDSTLTVTNAQLYVNDGDYTVSVTDAIGTRTSEAAALVVLVAPEITVQPFPANQTVLEGRTFTITISATGTLPISYRWRQNGRSYTNLVLYSTNGVLTIENAKATNAGRWDVAVTNEVGRVLRPSSPANVTVQPAPPFFAVQPSNQTMAAGADAVLVSEARGTEPLSYQWYFQGTELLPQQTAATLILSNLQPSDAGDYLVVAANSLGMATSEVAQITILEAPQITQQPVDQAATVCSDAVFTVSAAGGESLTYQWYFNATTPLPGETGDTLTIHHPTPAQAGDYTAVASNASGSTTSTVAVLTVMLGDADSDGMSDEWELAQGLNPCSAADRDRDPDGDGRSNWEEYLSGTDPHDPDSVLRITLLDDGNGGARIQFMALPNVSYSIEFRVHLTDGAWQKLLDVPAQATAHAVDTVDAQAGASGTRFYRIVTPQQP